MYGADVSKFTRFVARAIFACGLGLATNPAGANPVNWQFQSAAGLGGTISGSFTYDADLDLYSDVSVATSGGNLPTQTFLFDVTAVPGPSVLEFAPINGDLTNIQILVVNLDALMTNVGGALGLDGVQLFTYINAT